MDDARADPLPYPAAPDRQRLLFAEQIRERDVDVVPADVLLAINGKPISRPDQLQTVWDSLRTANELRALVWRGDDKLELAFTIQPAVDATAPAPTPSPTK